MLDLHPIKTQMATSGILGGAGDMTTQYFEHKWDEDDKKTPKSWDFRRIFAVAFFGVYFMGPVGHVWYEKLDIFCHSRKLSKAAMIAVKVCGDTFLFGPICLWAFFVSVSLMEGISWKHTEQKIRRDFVPTYLVDYAMWPIVQGLNFKYVPVIHQLMVVNLMCYLDDIFLSYVQHNSLPKFFQIIEDWWEETLAKYGWDSDLKELEEREEEDERRRKESWLLAHPETTTVTTTTATN
jgi:protein Mpv17